MNNTGNNMKKYLSSLDWVLIVLVTVALTYGVLLIKSATNVYGNSRQLIVQIGAILLGFVCIFVMSKIDYDHILKYYRYFYIMAVLLLVVVLVLGQGEEETGRGSWIPIPGLGINVQPSEIAKIFFIISLAKVLDDKKENINRPKNMLLIALQAGIIIGLVVIDNLGSALVYMFVFSAMCFVSGVSLWYFLAAAGIITAAAPFIWEIMEDYQRSRILVAYNPDLDPLGFGMQVKNSIRAIESGGIFGQGYQNGNYTQSDIIAEQETDFIFSAAGEEFGFIGAIILIALLAAIILRIFYVSRSARNDVGSLMCVGVATMFMSQSIVNIGMCIAMMPVIGITLPFFSYGGSSMISTMLAIGVVQSVCARRYIYYFSTDE